MQESRVPALLICFGLGIHAGPITYSVADLGVLSGGSVTTGRGVSSNGRVTGYGDTGTATSQAFSWSGGTGYNVAGPSSSDLAYGYGINSAGQFVGYSFSADQGQYTAFLYNGSTFVAIPTLGGSNNVANGINDGGVVVGWSEDSDGIQTAFVYSGGTTSGFASLPSGSTSWANAINSGGIIVGADSAGGGANQAFSYDLDTSTWSDLGAPQNYTSSEATSISSSGLIAGFAGDGSSFQAFLLDGLGFHLLGTLAGDSFAYGVNSSGIVVGTSGGVAFLYSSGIFDLNTLLDGSGSGWLLEDAMAINDLGQIVGTGLYNGEQHAYLLTLSDSSEVPEPGTWAMLAGGLATIALLRRRVKQ